MVEIFFSIITRQAIRRGSFNSVKELIASISRYIEGWNETLSALRWTKPAAPRELSSLDLPDPGRGSGPRSRRPSRRCQSQTSGEPRSPARSARSTSGRWLSPPQPSAPVGSKSRPEL
jgi:hypothetical protein